MRRITADGKFQYRPSMVRYSIAVLVRLGGTAVFFLVVWLILGRSQASTLILALFAISIVLVPLSFIAPLLIRVEAEFGRIDGPNGFGFSTVLLNDVQWSDTWHSRAGLHIQGPNGAAVTVTRPYFSADELEEMFLVFTGGNRREPKEQSGEGLEAQNVLVADS